MMVISTMGILIMPKVFRRTWKDSSFDLVVPRGVWRDLEG